MADPARSPRVLSPAMRRILRAYGPVILLALVLLLVALLVPTIERTAPTGGLAPLGSSVSGGLR